MKMQPGDWVVRCYYADDVKPPKKPGELAIEVVCRSGSLKDMEVAAGESRTDIGRVTADQVSR